MFGRTVTNAGHVVEDLLGLVHHIRRGVLCEHLLELTERHQGPDDLRGRLEVWGNRIEHDVQRADSPWDGTNVANLDLLAQHIGVVCPIYGHKAVAVVDVIEDKLGDLVLKVRTVDSPFHVRLDGLTLVLGFGHLVIAFPPQPFALGEQRCHVVGIEVITNLTQLRNGGLVLPRKLRVSSLGRIRGKHVTTDLIPLCNLHLAICLPVLKLLSNFYTQTVWGYAKGVNI